MLRNFRRDVHFFVEKNWASPRAWLPVLGTALSATLIVINYSYEMPQAYRKVFVTTGFGGLIFFLPLLWQGLLRDFNRVGGFFLPSAKSLSVNICVVVAWASSLHYVASLAGGSSFWRSMYLGGNNFHPATTDSWVVLAGAITVFASFLALWVLQKREWNDRLHH